MSRDLEPGLRDLVVLLRDLIRDELRRSNDAPPQEDVANQRYPIDLDDVVDDQEARRVLGTPSDATWERWHARGTIAWFVAPGTNRRLYSRRWLLEWLRSGARGAASATPAPAGTSDRKKVSKNR